MKNIVLIGSGNVATHIGSALYNAGYNIVQVWSRKMSNAQLLANKLNAIAIDTLEAIDTKADLYIISVSDDVISEIAKSLKEKTIVHTAGSVSMSILDVYTDKYGVFYPLQTFSKEKEVDFKNIPLLIESNNLLLQEELIALANKISNKVSVVDSIQRKYLHVAAVFACNFTNYFYGIAQDLLDQNGLNFDLIRPLILETAQKAQIKSPKTVQTGPAVRKDTQVVSSHIDLLQSNPDIQQLYSNISQLIMKQE